MNRKPGQWQFHEFTRIKAFNFFYWPILILVVLLLVFLGHREHTLRIKNLEENAKDLIELQSIKTAQNFDLIVTDLLFFSEYNALLDYLDMPQRERQHLSEDLTLFSRGSRLYDQIRVIDSNGWERIRINLDSTGRPWQVAEPALQNKKDRYYFTDAIKLGKGEVFISPMDLNVEADTVEWPHKPMIRFATPIFSRQGQKRGILIFNYMAVNIIDDLLDIAANTPGESWLLNRNGYWLYHPDEKHRWGFMLTQRHGQRFTLQKPEVWDAMHQKRQGQLHEEGNILTYNTLFPLENGWLSSSGAAKPFEASSELLDHRQYHWFIVNMLDKQILAGFERSLYIKYGLILLINMITIALGVWALTSREMLKASIIEKSSLLREVHHRVRNNLQIILSINNLQLEGIENPEAKAIIEKAQSRINAIALIEDKIYEGKRISSVDVEAYLRNIINHLIKRDLDSEHSIRVEVDVPRGRLNMEQLLPCGMMVSELFDNVLKHAYETGVSGNILIQLRQSGKNTFELQVADDGKGFSEDVEKGLGLVLTELMADQLNGHVQFDHEAGTRCRVVFSKIDL